jgi:hypothetical protein
MYECCKPLRNAPYICTFGAPDQGQTLDVQESQTAELLEKRSFSLAALPISLYRYIPKPNVDLHRRVDTAGPPRSD